MDEDDEMATLDDQFSAFAKFLANDRDGTTIDLYRSDYWLRQSKVLNDRSLTMTDTGVAWMKFSKSELTYGEWCEFLRDICITKELDHREVEAQLTCCGLPGSVLVNVPQYRDFFDTYVPPNQMVNLTDE